MFTTLIATASESRNLRHLPGTNTGFLCSSCWQQLPVQTNGGTGYGVSHEDGLICYSCCGKRDTDDMKETGRAVLYLSGNEVTNWPGTLRFPISHIKRSFHNFAGRNGRADFWFTALGKTWHGVNIGNSQIARCKALKG